MTDLPLSVTLPRELARLIGVLREYIFYFYLHPVFPTRLLFIYCVSNPQKNLRRNFSEAEPPKLWLGQSRDLELSLADLRAIVEIMTHPIGIGARACLDEKAVESISFPEHAVGP